jgi:hypothetical protein
MQTLCLGFFHMLLPLRTLLITLKKQNAAAVTVNQSV